MSETLYADAVVASDNVAPVNTANLLDALDSSTSTWVVGNGRGSLELSFPDTTSVGPGELGSVALHFTAKPVTINAPADHVLIGYLLDPTNGVIYSKTLFHFDPNSTSFEEVTVEWGALLSPEIINRLRLQVFMALGSRSELWQINDLRIVISDTFEPPTTTAIAPTGALVDNTPSFVWSTAIDDPATEIDYYGRVRVFNDDQYSAGGFDPATSPATWDSGWRVGPPLHEIISAVLPTDTYRAYISSLQLIFPGAPWAGRSNKPIVAGGVLHEGPYAGPLSFTIISTPPAVLGPAIRVDAVRDLTDDERALLVEPVVDVAPRVTLYSADGVQIRDLDVVSGSLILDAGSRIRGTLTMVCTDLDLVPVRREEALGENAPLHPYGSYVHVCSVMKTGRSTERVIGVGVFRLSTVRGNRVNGQVTVKAKDFGLNLTESRFGYPVTRQDWISAAPVPYTVLATAQAIISEAGLAYRTPSSSAATVAVNYTNKKSDDRAAALDDLASSIDGWEWYFDIDGICYFGAGPDIVDDPIVYTFRDPDERAGRFVAQIIDRDQELSRDDTFDVVVASDQAGLYIGGAYDASPNSVIARSAGIPASLFVGAGTFSPGGKPFFFTSPVITSQPTAEAAARTRLAGVALPAEGITASCGVIPDLRPGKMIAMPRDGESALVKWQVVKVTMPLAVGPKMTFDAVTIGEAVTPAS